MKKKNHEKSKELYRAICQNPGLSQGELARLMGLTTKDIYCLLPSLECKETLVTEDENERLWEYKE